MDAAVIEQPHRRAQGAVKRALFGARLPAAGGAARDHRACSFHRTAHGVMVQQPALAGVHRQRRSQGAVSQGDLRRGSSGAGDEHDFPPPREYLGVYLERRRESGFQLYNTLGIVRGDKAAYAKQALENYNFFGAPHVAIIPPTSRSASTAQSIAAPMSAISCWPRRRWGSAPFRRPRWRGTAG